MPSQSLQSLLKEIDALKKEIEERRPFDKQLLKEIREYYRIGLTYSSNALEGNTLTESETKIVLEEGITIGGKPLIDHLEALGMSDAYDFLYAENEQKILTEEMVKRFHHLFYFRIDEHEAGQYRKRKVFLTGSKFPLPAPEQVPYLMAEWIGAAKLQRKELHPIVFAATAHKDFVFIHPFIDGNGRVARLIMNLILLEEGYTIAIIPPIARARYITALEKAHTDDDDFIEFIAEMVRESQRDHLRLF
jgi:Fic family protein